MPSLKFIVQAADINDAESIKRLIDFYSYKNALLPKSIQKIKEEIHTFKLVRLPKDFSLEETKSSGKIFSFTSALLSGPSMSASQSHSKPEPPPIYKISSLSKKDSFLKEIKNPIDSFDEKIDIMGIIALKPFKEDLFEIRSFAVWPRFQNFRIGKLLLTHILNSVESGRIFTLTFIPKYFARYGFTKVSKLSFPEKIWEDCLSCPFKEDCNETAMQLIK